MLNLKKVKHLVQSLTFVDHAKHVVIATLCFLLGITGIAFGDCDPNIDCTSCSTKGERMKCKFDALSNEGSTLLEKLNGPPFAGVQTPASLDGLQRSKDRLEKEKGRLQADDFRLLTKKKETSCQILEAVYEDGVCGPGEDCAEVIGDGIGNDDGICKPKNGKKREVCVQICDDEASLQDETNIDDDLSIELEGIFDEMRGHTKEMNDSLQEVSTLMTRLEVSEDPDDPCPLDTGGLSRTSSLLYLAARTAAVSSRGGADIAERLCDQQVIMNCAACCAPGEVIAGALEAAWTAIEITESTINSSTIDTALSCVAKLKRSASDNTAQLVKIENDLKIMEQSQIMMIDLLNTPQGQRTNFPITKRTD
jgi:hypothetical protein